MRVSKKGTKQDCLRHPSTDGPRFKATKLEASCNRERESERARESESRRESGEDEEKRRRKSNEKVARVSRILTLRPVDYSAILYISNL
jgi:hypothetical protein